MDFLWFGLGVGLMSIGVAVALFIIACAIDVMFK